MEKEIWKDIPNYEGFYQVSNFGNVKSLSRVVKNRFSYRTTRERILKPTIDSDGYGIVNLSIKSKTKKFRKGRLVGICFLSLTDKDTIDHKDFDKTNDKLNNLRIVSRRYNSSYTSNNKSNLPIGITKKGNRFQARKSINGVRKYLGLFKTVEEAKSVYNNYV